jgi:hypothetical protein
VQGAVYLEFLADTLQDVTRHVKLITGVNSDTGSNLVFLLSRHDLSVGSTDLNSGVKAGTVDGIGDSTSVGVLGTGRAVVGALGTVGNTILGPAEGSTLIKVEEGEFLLKAEPDFLVLLSLEGSGGKCTSVSGKSLSSRSVSITHDQNVVNTIGTRAEGILENSAGSQNNLRVISGSLIGRRSIKVPSGKSLDSLGTLGGESTCLGTAFTLGIDPYVFGKDLVGGVGKGIETVNDGGVELRLTGLDIELLGHVEGHVAAGNRGGGGEGSGGADGGEEGDGELHGDCLLM